MTNRERLRKTFNHEPPQPIPAPAYARAEVKRELVAYYGVRSFKGVLRILAAARGPWAWTTPIWWEEKNR